MGWSFFDGPDRIEIDDCPRFGEDVSSAESAGERIDLREAWQAQQFTRRYFRDADNLHRVRALLKAQMPLVHRLDDEAVLQLLARHFENANLQARLYRYRPAPVSPRPVDAVPWGNTAADEVAVRVKGPPVTPVEVRYWIEIELVDEAGQPIAGEPYTLKTPEGELIQGQLDASGRARVETLTASGECLVSFPALDGAAWELVQSQPGPA